MSTHGSSPDHAPRGGYWAEERRRDPGAIVAELEELLVQGGAGVIAVDLEGVITHWSFGAERLYGWSGDEAIGMSLLDLLIAPRDQQIAVENIESILSTGAWEGEFELRRKDGEFVLAYVRGTLIKDDAGRPVGILGLSMDASAPPRGRPAA